MLIRFEHNSIQGAIDHHGFVQFSGMGFEFGAAAPDLRESIRRDVLEEVQIGLQGYAAGMAQGGRTYGGPGHAEALSQMAQMIRLVNAPYLD